MIKIYQAWILSDAPSEADMVDKFSRNFDRDVQQAVITQKITSIGALVNLLDIQEHIGAFNSFRGSGKISMNAILIHGENIIDKITRQITNPD